MPALDFSVQGTDKLFDSMQRAVNELGTEGKKALSWGGGVLCESLRAATRKAPGKRELLAWQEDGRTRYGMHIWRNGLKARQEIDALKPGVVPFNSRTTGQALGRDRWTDEVHRIERYTQTEAQMGNHPALIIRMAGLAKKAWSIARGVLIATAYGDTVRTKRPVASVTWGGTIASPALTITNHLNYAVPALKNGEASISESLEKAGRALETRIERELKKRGLVD